MNHVQPLDLLLTGLLLVSLAPVASANTSHSATKDDIGKTSASFLLAQATGGSGSGAAPAPTPSQVSGQNGYINNNNNLNGANPANGLPSQTQNPQAGQTPPQTPQQVQGQTVLPQQAIIGTTTNQLLQRVNPNPVFNTLSNGIIVRDPSGTPRTLTNSVGNRTPTATNQFQQPVPRNVTNGFGVETNLLRRPNNPLPGLTNSQGNINGYNGRALFTNAPAAGVANTAAATSAEIGLGVVTNASGTGYQQAGSGTDQIGNYTGDTGVAYSLPGGDFIPFAVENGGVGSLGRGGAVVTPGSAITEAAGTALPARQAPLIANPVPAPAPVLTVRTPEEQAAFLEATRLERERLAEEERERDRSTIPQNPAPDAPLTDRVRSALKFDNALPASAREVRVAVTGSTVTLYGVVPDKKAAQTILERINRIPGVTKVSNQLNQPGDGPSPVSQ